MWILVITLFSIMPGSSTSNGSLNLKYAGHAECIKAKEQILATVKIDGYRVNAGCVYIAK
jgi:hypothetical protein